MNKNVKTLIFIAVFVLFISAAGIAYNNLSKNVSLQKDILVTDNKGELPDKNTDMAAGEDNNEENKKIIAPDFVVLDSNGTETALSELFGKPIVVNFWASWCPPCKSEMPDFDEVYNEVGEGVTFMMVDLVDGQRETMEKGMSYVEEQGFTFPVYYDTEGEAAYEYGISSIPTTIFIDKDGYVVTGAQGAIDKETLLKGIELITGE